MKCRLCGGACYLLGKLGMLKWYRCRDCGMEFYKKTRESKKVKAH